MEGLDAKKGMLFLEGNFKAFIDGEEKPSLEETGTEDWGNGGWYWAKGTFHDSYHGLTVKEGRKISAYRFHRGAIPFDKSFRAIIHHGEFDEVKGNYSSVAYFYTQE